MSDSEEDDNCRLCTQHYNIQKKDGSFNDFCREHKKKNEKEEKEKRRGRKGEN